MKLLPLAFAPALLHTREATLLQRHPRRGRWVVSLRSRRGVRLPTVTGNVERRGVVRLRSVSTSVAEAAASTIIAATPKTPLRGFVQFLFAFVLGGLFFSTALAGVAAFAAVGKENLGRLFAILRIVVRNTWEIFVLGLSETRKALRMGGKWKWKEAWNEFKKQLLNTRKAAAEGVEAIRLEANLYSAAVGKPGLIPLQYVVDRITPYTLKFGLENALRDTLKGLKNDNIRRARLLSFEIGDETPQLVAGRVYDVGDDTMAFDVDLKWSSTMEAKLFLVTKTLGLRLPVDIRNVSFDGCLRVELTPLVDEPPGYGAAILSLPSVPVINLSVRVAGAMITKVPWLKTEILKEIDSAIRGEVLWPKRIIVPTLVKNNRQLVPNSVLEDLKTNDPFINAEVELSERQPLIKEYIEKFKANPDDVATVLGVDVDEKPEGEEVEEEANEGSPVVRTVRRFLGYRF